MKRLMRTLSVASVCLLLSACAMAPKAPPEVLVQQRANERWQALIKGDFDKAYAYSTPGFKAVVDSSGFRGRTGIAGKWLGAEAIRVECDAPVKCKAVVRLDFKPLIYSKSFDKISTHIDETWLLEDGQWWHFQKI